MAEKAAERERKEKKNCQLGKKTGRGLIFC
jgi:hypothetical protein